MPDLIARLRCAPHRFNLFQAISLLERSAPARLPVGTGVGIDEAVRLGGHVGFGFAPSDIASLDDSRRAGPALTLRTAALTLAGAQGPVAAPFTELLLARRRRRDHAGLDFLDIFNGRLLGFWYRARCKHHLALQSGTAPAAPLPRTLDAMSGLGRAEGARGPDGEAAWLRHAGLQGAAPRSLASLLALVRDRLQMDVDGRQFVGGWHALAPSGRARLQGRRGSAGAGGCSLGARAWDQAAGIALTTAPLSPAQFAALLPDGPRFALLCWLVARHLQADFAVTLTLTLATPPATRLGRRQALAPRLGRNAWLCSAADARRTPAASKPVRLLLRAPTHTQPGGT
jgi:type VI secretion system protein ImpH